MYFVFCVFSVLRVVVGSNLLKRSGALPLAAVVLNFIPFPNTPQK